MVSKRKFGSGGPRVSRRTAKNLVRREHAARRARRESSVALLTWRQVSKPAVSPTSKSAGRAARALRRFGNLRYSATRQKPQPDFWTAAGSEAPRRFGCSDRPPKKRCRRFALPPQSKSVAGCDNSGDTDRLGSLRHSLSVEGKLRRVRDHALGALNGTERRLGVGLRRVAGGQAGCKPALHRTGSRKARGCCPRTGSESPVAQTASLRYRGFPIRRPSRLRTACRLEVGDTCLRPVCRVGTGRQAKRGRQAAGWKPALRSFGSWRGSTFQ